MARFGGILLFVLVLLLITISALTRIAEAKSVNVVLKSNWNDTPLLAEASEFFAAESPDLFWKYVTEIVVNGGVDASAPVKEMYSLILEFAAKELSADRQKLLKFALSTRYYSPKLEMYNQLGADLLNENFASEAAHIQATKQAFVTLNGKIYTSASSLAQALESMATVDSNIELFEFDHEYGGATGTDASNHKRPVAILNAQLGTRGFTEFHAVLRKAQEQHAIRYVFRHWINNSGADKINLQGYGTELQIKNMEYSAVEKDKKANAGDQPTGVQGEEAAPAEEGEGEIAGFLFDTLIERKPQYKSELLTFKDTLKTVSSKDEKIELWEMKDLGLQSSQRILGASDPLTLLRDLSQNFPNFMSSLSRIKTNATIREEIATNQLFFNAGESTILLNGRYLNLEKLNPFNLLDTLRADGNLIGELSSMHLDAETVKNLLYLNMDSASATYRFDVRPPPITSEDGTKIDMVVWANDIEKDHRYSQLPPNLKTILSINYWGQIRFARRNLFNMLLVVDPTTRRGLGLINAMQHLINQNAPARFGVLLVGKEDMSSYASGSFTGYTKLMSKSIEIDVMGSMSNLHNNEPASDSTGQPSKEDAGTPTFDAASTSLATRVIQIFHYLKTTASPNDAFEFLKKLEVALVSSDSEDLTEGALQSALRTFPRNKINYDEIISSPKYFKAAYQSAKYLVEKGFTSDSIPTVIFNGAIYTIQEGVSLDRVFVQGIRKEHAYAQELVRSNRLIDRDRDLLGKILEVSGAFSRYNPKIFSDEKNIVALPFSEVNSRTLQYLMAKDDGSIKPFSHIMVIDVNSRSGLNLLNEALSHVANSDRSRVALVQNTARPVEKSLASRMLATMFEHPDTDAGLAYKFVSLLNQRLAGAGETLHNEDSVFANVLAQLSGKVSNKKHVKVIDALKKLLADHDNDSLESLAQKVYRQSRLATSVLNLKSGQNAVITNGRLIEISDRDYLLREDFATVEAVEGAARVFNVQNALDSASIQGLDADDITSAFRSDLVMAVNSLLANDWFERGPRSQFPAHLATQHSSFYYHNDTSVMNAVAIINPLSVEAQKFTPFLILLKDYFGVSMRVFLNPQLDISQVPLKSYYRYLIQPELSFNEKTGKIAGPSVWFTNVLPTNRILTLNMDVPEPWLVESTVAAYDLDNIKLDDVTSNTLYAEYELSNIVVTGSCIDLTTGEPPRGLQMILGTNTQIHIQDTLVMSNFGYFQFKANPRVWRLRFDPGSKAAEIYEIVSLTGIDFYGHKPTSAQRTHNGIADVLVTGFDGEFLMLRVRKQPGKEGVDYLASLEPKPSQKPQKKGFWQQLSSLVTSNRGDAEGQKQGETVNVFSVASGHMYERLLKIMMLSVVKNTKSPVKFWFIKNYLSPQFKQFIPKMAKHYGFEYELVTYKWPYWLHKQTEKQRIIWAYKVLFLDVLFPLDVNKIIFVDADQVTRGDLTELAQMDLRGAPLGYTPFCDSNTEMEGFRFWKQGYWAQHLRGKPYHISALYVVDIHRLRKMAVGDQYRMLYDNLSKDPNSLSNLDQDLPNFAQHQVPIFSLPQEWLWCETWCSQESKARAKTIDLCNNPMTKEHKLDSAKRIIPEWVDYDEEIKRFEASILANSTTTA